jgi:FkbM family methyltransferase
VLDLYLNKARAAWHLRLEVAGLRPKRSFGLNALDLRLLEFLNRRNGFFIEAGANDGLNQSNTAYFERYLGWRGLLIEPIPNLAILCRANRPRALVEQCALVPAGFNKPTVSMTYCNLMSLVDGAQGSRDSDQEHINKGKQFLSREDAVYTVEVPARTLTDVLDARKVKKVDFLSLDVEGFEACALAGLDFALYAPTWILVEANDPAAIESFLLPRYEFIGALSHHDRLYKLR